MYPSRNSTSNSLCDATCDEIPGGDFAVTPEMVTFAEMLLFLIHH
jgi:hypothetical protein